MLQGKKQKINSIFYILFFHLKLIFKYQPILFFYISLLKLRSTFILVPKRRSTKIYILPTYLYKKQQYQLAIYWLVKVIKKNNLKQKLFKKFFLN
jgi:ribosomal protein S7